VLTCHQPTVSGRACPGGDQPVAEVVPYGGESARVIATRLGGIPVSVDEQSTKRDLEDAWVAVAVLALISSAGAVAALLAAGLTVVLFTERLSRRPGLARAEM
jgi:hypothetical protein